MLSTATRPRVLVRTSERGTVVEVEDRLYLRLDRRGRWLAYGEGGALFRRAMDGRVLQPRGRAFRALDATEGEAVHAWVGRRAGELLELLGAAAPHEIALLGRLEDARERLQEATCWTRAPLATAARRFREAYPETVPILPPHRYRDVVVLPATGCPNARCAYCAFYRSRPFRVLDDRAFSAHVDAVRTLFGSALSDRDGIFLGSASALSLRDDALQRRLATVERAFGRLRRGVASFYDADRGSERRPAAWGRLRKHGLTEATLGLETGDAKLRAGVGKSADLDRFARAVRSMKAAGLGVSISVLIGLGGAERADAHRARTIAFLAGLPLGREDRVYLSPLSGALPRDREAEEGERWRDGLREVSATRVGDYRIERFAFFA